MKIEYQKYKINIHFEKPVFFRNYPTFILRSIIGNQLRRMSCVLKTKRCPDCELKYTCVYAKLFETYILKDNSFLEGRNRASHPYICQTDVLCHTETSTLSIDLVLLGYAITYFPYFYYAIYHAGRSGILRDRIKYEIQNVESNGEDLLISKEMVKTDTKTRNWKLDNNVNSGREKQIRIDFKTPYRLKMHGTYVSEFKYPDLIKSIFRRTGILTNLYGVKSGEFSEDDFHVMEKNCEFNLRWIDQKYYSARQEQELIYGGIIGSMNIIGFFSPFEESLLEAGEIFNIGKNSSFGLGKMEVKKEINQEG